MLLRHSSKNMEWLISTIPTIFSRFCSEDSSACPKTKGLHLLERIIVERIIGKRCKCERSLLTDGQVGMVAIVNRRHHTVGALCYWHEYIFPAHNVNASEKNTWKGSCLLSTSLVKIFSLRVFSEKKTFIQTAREPLAGVTLQELQHETRGSQTFLGPRVLDLEAS